MSVAQVEDKLNISEQGEAFLEKGDSAPSPSKIREKVKTVEGEIEDLLSSQWSYAKRMLKFSLASWIFGISLFIATLLAYKGPEFLLKIPPLSLSLLVGACAAPITIASMFLRNKNKKVEKLKDRKSKLLSQYEKALILSEKNKEEILHSLLRHDVKNKIRIAQGYHKILQKFDLSEEVKKYLEKADRAVRKSTDIIEKVRTLREIRKENTVKEVEIKPLLEKTIANNRDMAGQNSIRNIAAEIAECRVRGGGTAGGAFLQPSGKLHQTFKRGQNQAHSPRERQRMHSFCRR
ncbi:hypothetical protein AKJ38_04305 [candidate division MSBL1 archaeon SCGC-AAA259I14]|uniref:Uncharacterized protein n=1 Tax=candidate division MSBL1 archaeon SCGC-AAA259I14 TaxID=1698268 RepID=A0A133UNH1_9EURY|nr:hypothetical protein AKJ38_04305 [candidate division MSBL1 archaeon SCGC-AAA259I14]